MEIILVGFFIGLLGSVHCIGMCGPIAIVIPTVKNNLILSKFIYNLGRIFTYVFLGFFAGIIGERIYLDKFQNYFSFISGLILLAGVIIYLNQSRILKIKLIGLFLNFLKNKIAENFKIRKYKSVFITGILNGLLPCGFIYIALSGAVITGDKISGMIYMLFFGIGTLPVMMGVSVYGSRLKKYFGNRFAKISPVFLTLVALLLILRGMNLGIPVISPEMKKEVKTEILICD